MKIDPQFCFTHPSGEDIYLYVLKNNKGTEVKISNYGAIVQSFIVRQADGHFNDIVLGFDKMEDYISPAYLSAYSWFGAAIGRYGNRIKKGIIEIDGLPFQLTQNNDQDQLHGGHEGFDKKVWRTGKHTATSIGFSYTSQDGEEGFPGNLAVTIIFELTDDNEFSYTYTAVTDKATAVNLTHHGYFNLDLKKTSVNDHEVLLPAPVILDQDKNFVATGDTIPVEETPYDFRKKRSIGPNTVYDQSYVVKQKDNKPTLVAEVSSPQSGLTMQVYSTEPVVHFYTGKYIPEITGKDGQQYGPFSGFCLETQVHPNAINVPNFPRTVLRQDEQYYQKTIYKVS